MSKTAVAKSTMTRTKKSAAVAKIAGVEKSTISDLVEVFKSLADQSRLQILLILAHQGELHVSAICDELGQSQPAVSHHLTQLKHAGLVDFDRNGKYNIYKLDAGRLSRILEAFFPNAFSAQQKVAFGELELSFKAK